ncbi:uncharacterized protein LOC133530421 [Cydia pomonella]|uniref:uncharacterized protein LOC133530421 n=1 Tax=Cydia pomonella TaxID=82600 RepID=UPI002ADE5921|nr:uncharacterized protein LOC133530421 [Cydia pomonella]
MKSDRVVKNKMEINRRFQTEYLMNNILDQDFQAMLFPLNFVQTCFLMPRFSIINNFITPDNHVSFYIKSIIGCIILTSSHVFRFIYYSEVNKSLGTDLVVVVLPYFDVIFFSLTSIVTHVVNSLQRSNVVEGIIKMQHVLDFIKIDKQQFLCKHKIQNWLSVLLVIIIYVFQWLFACFSYSVLDLLVHFYLIVPMMIFDMQVVHVTRTVEIIKDELFAWIHKMEEYKNIHITPQEEVLLHSAVSGCDMFNAYTDIIKAFHISNKVYQFSVSPYFVIEQIREYTNVVFPSLFEVPTAGTINLAESCCAQILSNAIPTGEHLRKLPRFSVFLHFPGIRKTCKNVLRLNRASLCKMSAFGVFELDATFPLRLLSVIVTYVVVLLQFAFLS